MSLGLFLVVHLVLFVMGTVGTFLNRRNFIIMLMCIELMLLSVNLIFLTASVLLDDLNGQLAALLVMTAAASETALGLALCVLHYRMRQTLDVELVNLMKGSKGYQKVIKRHARGWPAEQAIPWPASGMWAGSAKPRSQPPLAWVWHGLGMA
jgi:NADH-quinone oxidoreductase subunit K